MARASPERAWPCASDHEQTRAYQWQLVGCHGRDVGGPLHVVELPPVVLVPALDSGPAEEDVAAGLQNTLPGDDPFAVLAVLAGWQVRLEHGVHGLLDLQEQRLTVVSPSEQYHEAAGADAADANHLQGDVSDLEPAQQVRTIGLDTRVVGVETRLDPRPILLDVHAVGQVAQRYQQRRLGPDPQRAVHCLTELGEGLLAVALAGGLGAPLDPLAVCLGGRGLHQHVKVELGVPDVHRRGAREPRHRRAIPGDGPGRQRLLLLGVAVVACGEHETCGHPFDVPLPRSRQRLVEVVDVEDLLPFGGGEGAEVGQMRVPAQLG